MRLECRVAAPGPPRLRDVTEAPRAGGWYGTALRFLCGAFICDAAGDYASMEGCST